MKNYYEELRPTVGENFQIYIHDSTTADKKPTAAHIHDFIEVLYCLRGEYHLCVNDFETVFKKGEMIVIGARNVHEIEVLEDLDGEYNGDLLAIKFQPEMIYSAYSSFAELTYVIPFIFSSTKAYYYFTDEKIKKTDLSSVFVDTINELKSHNYGYELALKSNVYRIILWIIRLIRQNNDIMSSFSMNAIKKIEDALAYIEKNYTESLSVKEIAKTVFMEYTYFSRVFKQLTGMSCSKYISVLRVQKSEMLLIEGNMNISEISDRVGFDNVSYYIKQFRLIHGISPKQYQKKINCNNPEYGIKH